MQNVLGRVLAKAERLKLVDVNHLHEIQEIYYLKRLFRLLDVDLVIDVGANTGQYASRLRQHVAYRGTIVSVEPIPEMVERLNSTRGSDPNWHVEQAVVTDVRGRVTFNVMNEAQCSSLEEPNNRETALFATQTAVARKIEVDGVPLDELIEKWMGDKRFKRPFLKLDTQGHDAAIVRSCKRLREFVAFQSELSVKRLYEGTPVFADAVKEYSNRGFDLGALVPNNGGAFPQLIEVDCIMIRDDLAGVPERGFD